MTLKEMHFAEITNERARALYEKLEKACTERDGACDEATLTLIADAAQAEQMKELLQSDIRERGIGKEYSNYRQKYYRPNESVKELRAVMDQQRRILKELRLTPASRNAEIASVDDGFSEF